MNCFELVKAVLDDFYQRRATPADSEKDQRIAEQILSQEGHYGDLWKKAGPDYGNNANVKEVAGKLAQRLLEAGFKIDQAAIAKAAT